VIWHAGEPLVVPPRFYEEAIALIARHNRAGVRVQHSFQTNGTLLDDKWCDFIRQHDVRVGVSIDGPAFLHDRCRRTRGGKGTHARVMEGIRLLHAHTIPFHVITVLTRWSLDYPDELYDFYVSAGIDHVGFNIEEIEGPHVSSSLQTDDIGQRFRRFIARFYDLASGGRRPLWVREFAGAMGLIAAGGFQGPVDTHETRPLAIINVDCEGNFTTFSPELLGLDSLRYGSFALGNVQADDFEQVVRNPRFQAMHADIESGIARCRQTCPYFKFCGGGAPANKYFENGSFDSTETMFCRLGRQAVFDVVLDKLERRAELPVLSPAGAEV
jgi:uncharacterized protein